MRYSYSFEPSIWLSDYKMLDNFSIVYGSDDLLIIKIHNNLVLEIFKERYRYYTLENDHNSFLFDVEVINIHYLDTLLGEFLY